MESRRYVHPWDTVYEYTVLTGLRYLCGPALRLRECVIVYINSRGQALSR